MALSGLTSGTLLPPPPSYAPAAFAVYDEHLQDEIFLDDNPSRSVRETFLSLPMISPSSAHDDVPLLLNEHDDGSNGNSYVFFSTWRSLKAATFSNLLDHQSQALPGKVEAACGTSERPSRRVAFAQRALVREFQDRPEVGCFAIFGLKNTDILYLSKLASICRGDTFCSQGPDRKHQSEYEEPTKFSKRPPVASAKSAEQTAIAEWTSNSLELLCCLSNVVVCLGRCIYYNSVGCSHVDRLPVFLDAAMPEELFKSSTPEEAIQSAQALARAIS
mmetsp:Transcript_28453/g.51421  ORF Transcript_28453/g.51421 Transcript_28453/m.51421 type:complete len:275 (-) Transcript_28453:33-857(-)